MRRMIAAAICALFCSCVTTQNTENNQTIQDFTPQICNASNDFAQYVHSELVAAKLTNTVMVRYCGPLSQPDQMFGLALIEATITMPNGVLRHSFLLLKYANNNGKWSLIAEPETIIDFAHKSDG